MQPIPPHLERRQINAEIAQMREAADAPQLIAWLQEFTQALRTNEPLGPIIELLQDRLMPLLDELFDEEFQANVPQEYDNRPVRQFIDLLLDPLSILHNDAIEQLLGHLRRDVREAEPARQAPRPSPPQARIRMLADILNRDARQEVQAQARPHGRVRTIADVQNDEARQAAAQQAERIQEQMAREMQEAAEIERQIQELMARDQQRMQREAEELGEIGQAFDGLVQEAEHAFAGLRVDEARVLEREQHLEDELRARDAAAHAVLRARMDQLEADIERLKVENEQLAPAIRATNDQITATERSNAQLKHAINEARQEMKKKQREWIGIAIAIGVTVLVSCIAPPGLSFAVGKGMGGSSQPAVWARFARPL